MAKALFIKKADLVKNTAISGNVDTDKFIQFIRLAQEIHVQNYLGTDLYDKDGKLSKTIPFEHNLGYIFTGDDTLHGVEEGKKIKVDRRGIQLNYVTFETDWPAMQL